YFQDAVASEAYLGTARRRVSVRRHLRLVDYRLHEGCNARAWVCIGTDTDLTVEPDELLFFTGDDDAPGEPFEPVGTDTIELVATQSTIGFGPGGDGDCCWGAGATAATLRDDWVAPPATNGQTSAEASEDSERERSLRLAAGDVLVLEEVLGPRTG